MNHYLASLPPWLGSKRSIARQIMRVVRDEGYGPEATIADAFLGGGGLAMAAKALGYRVHGNDMSPISYALGQALIENSERIISNEERDLALSAAYGHAKLPPAKELSLPDNCRRLLAGMVELERHLGGLQGPLLRTWIAKTALTMSMWGIPTMAAGSREWDQMTPGQAQQLKRTGHPMRVAKKQCASINAGVFSNGRENTMRRGDAVEFLAEVEADVMYCNPPEAPIWMADLSFKTLGEIEVGDEVMGWSLEPPAEHQERTDKRPEGERVRQVAGRRRNWLRTAKVEAITRRRAPLVKVTMASGREIRCTPDHLWSRHPNSGRPLGRRQTPHEWITAEPGECLSHVIDPIPELPPELAQVAAWLGGIFDGEGSANRRAQPTIAQCRTHNPEVCKRIEESLTRLGFEWTYYEPKREQGSGSYAIQGGRAAHIRFMVWCRPARWEAIRRRVLGANWRTKDEIVSVEPAGEGEVLSMTTSTGNYVAWGYASKNCDPPYPGTTSYERAYVGVNRLLEPDADDTPSEWSANDGWLLLENAFDAAERIPLWVISMGKGADPDRIVEMMKERGRAAAWRSLKHAHLPALKKATDVEGDELLLVGRRES